MQKTDLKKIFFFLTIVSIIILFIVKMSVSSRLLYVFSTFLFDSCVYVLIFLIYYGLTRLSKKIATPIFIILYLFHTFTAFITSYFMDDLFGKGYSFFSVSLGTAQFSFTYLFPWKYLTYAIISLALLVLISYLLSKFFKKYPSKKFLLSVSIFVLLLLVCTPIVFDPNFENFYVNSILRLATLGHETIIIDNNYSCDLDNSFFEKNNYPGLALQEKYKKIVVFVMESLIFDEYNKDITKVKENNFFELTKPNSNYYVNYYTPNQDSIPSIVTMLSSKFIPNEAYIYTQDYSLCWHKMMDAYNLIDYFNDKNYYTAFYVSNIQAPRELTRYKWGAIVDINGLYEYYDKNNYCFDPYPYETGCEDRVLLNQLIDEMKKEKTFIMQEFIFGHSYLYVKNTGLSKTEYYNKYFYEFYKAVKEQGLDKDLLVIIVSDHGLRDRSEYSYAERYNIPLIFIANDINYLENNVFLSHMDFKDILFSYLYGLDYKPNPFIYLVGPTGSSTIGYKDADAGFILEQGGTGEFDILSSNIKTQGIKEKLPCFLEYKEEFSILK